jgi:hypothetical protein
VTFYRDGEPACSLLARLHPYPTFRIVTPDLWAEFAMWFRHLDGFRIVRRRGSFNWAIYTPLFNCAFMLDLSKREER